ncbi:MAG: peptidylprolyl isomerase [Bacteroidota bacterium]
MIKHFLIAAACLLLCGSAFAQKEIIDRVVATVGGEYVLLSEVEEQYAAMSAERGALPDDFHCVIFDNLMAQRLLLNQAVLDSIVVADQEVEAQLSARLDRILTLMNNDFEQFEAYYGQTPSEVREQMRGDLKNQLLTERMRSQILNNVTVTPAEVKAFYDKIPKDSLPYFNSEVEVGEIAMFPTVNAEQRKIAVDRLTEIREQIINESATFQEMAQKYSQDGSSRSGGDLGMQKRGTFVPEFEAAAYNLEKGEISELVESEFGFHLIQLIERRGNAIHARHILIKPEITDADLELVKAKLDTVQMLIATDSLTFSEAVKKYSNDKVQSYNNDGRMVNPQSGNTFFEIGDLDPDIYFTLDTMDIIQVSAPFEFRDPRGEAGYRIVQLQSRTEPHKANLQQDYAKIQKAAIEQKKSQFINDWVQDKIESTYISIYDVYTCPNLAKWNPIIRP